LITSATSVTTATIATNQQISIIEGLDLILSYFKALIWPRRISTKTTENSTLPVYNRDEALARLKQSNLKDCKICAYPFYVEWVPTTTKSKLGSALNNTLKNIKDKLAGAQEVDTIRRAVSIKQKIRPFHIFTMSFKNCMLRIPGSYNSGPINRS
jgi:hypothetical protein